MASPNANANPLAHADADADTASIERGVRSLVGALFNAAIAFQRDRDQFTLWCALRPGAADNDGGVEPGVGGIRCDGRKCGGRDVAVRGADRSRAGLGQRARADRIGRGHAGASGVRVLGVVPNGYPSARGQLPDDGSAGGVTHVRECGLVVCDAGVGRALGRRGVQGAQLGWL
jgi:hypothetical protein